MKYLSSTHYFDYEDKNIQVLIEEFKNTNLSTKEKAVQLYLKIRDGWRYLGYVSDLGKEGYRASHISQRVEGNCLEKSILLVACLRGLNIPARIHLAKIKNHIAVEHLVEKFGTNELTPHGYVSMFLDEKWVKASPAFNLELCEKYKVAPLDFDGEQDSLLQQYDEAGSLFMEYLEDYGHFEEFPIDYVFEILKTNYPSLVHAYKF